MKHGLKVLQPQKLKDPGFLEELRSLQADLQVVVAFRMLPESVWNLPRLGTVNLHGSLLPQYRGAAPINWAIINGEKQTGVTTFKLKHEIDTGDILLQENFPIGENETAGELRDRMKDSQLLSSGSELKHAPKIHTDTCRIDWSQSVQKVFDLVRGLNPYPTAFTIINEKMLKVHKAHKETTPPKEMPGEYETDGKTFLKYACIDGYLHLTEVQMEGKKKMSIAEFLRGYRFEGNL
jgi:methionyl-tRNA formyltransferase